jgi:hypothetical protein
VETSRNIQCNERNGDVLHKKKLPYNQQDKWRRPVENVLSVKQTSTEKKLEIFPLVSMDTQSIS